MNFIDRITRRATRGVRPRVTPRPLLGVDDLARMGLAPLETVAVAMALVTDRRSGQESGAATDGVIPRRRADDWASPATTVDAAAETQDRRHLA